MFLWLCGARSRHVNANNTINRDGMLGIASQDFFFSNALI